MTVIDKSASLLIIDYPRMIEEKSLREAKCLDYYLPCTLLIDRQSAEGSVVNLSAGGCRFVIANLNDVGQKTPEKDRNAVIMCDSPAESWQFELAGVIVNTSEYLATATFGDRFHQDAAEQ